MENVIEVKNLSKKYGDKEVLKNVSFTVKKGTIHGFVGPNGAGKSTTIEILIGKLKKTSGNIYIEGKPVDSNPFFNENLAYIPVNFTFSPSERVKDFVLDSAFLSMKSLDSKKKKEVLEKMKNLLASLPSQQFSMEQKCVSLSTGQKTILLLFVLTISRPQKDKILVLDEVFNGLDPTLRQELFDSLKKFKKNNGTIFISSHILSDLDKLADEITIIKKGEIIHTGEKTGNIEEIYRNFFSKKNKENQKEIFEL